MDADLKIIVAECDSYLASRRSPSDAFYDAVARCENDLRSAAKFLWLSGADEEPMMPPRTMRTAASWLLNN